jgi:hypothetical protein
MMHLLDSSSREPACQDGCYCFASQAAMPPGGSARLHSRHWLLVQNRLHTLQQAYLDLQSGQAAWVPQAAVLQAEHLACVTDHFWEKTGCQWSVQVVHTPQPVGTHCSLHQAALEVDAVKCWKRRALIHWCALQSEQWLARLARCEPEGTRRGVGLHLRQHRLGAGGDPARRACPQGDGPITPVPSA